MTKLSTRDRIIKEADRLFYERGFNNTSFSWIAETVGISRGNFYHHFRTKDEILAAVIDERLAARRHLLDTWEARDTDTASRIRSFIHILITNQSKIMLYGCPVGTLCMELGRLDHPLQGEANKVMDLFRAWLRRQFDALGCAEDAEDFAMHVLAFSQGVAVLASTGGDKDFIQREVKRMCRWVDEVAAGAINC